VTVAAQTPSIKYTAAGAATVFSFPFRLLSTSDLSVTLDGVSAAGYTVSLGDLSGGSITFAVAPTGSLVIRRVMPASRALYYNTLGDFQALTVNEDFDRAIMIVQQLLEQLLRVPTLPEGTVAASFTLDAPGAGKPIRYKASGAGLEPYTPTDIAGNQALQTALLDVSLNTLNAAMVGFNAALNYAVRTVGHDSATYPSINSFAGVDPTGVANSAAAINTAMAAAGALGVKGLRFSGTYLIAAALTPPSNMLLQGHVGATIRYATGDINGVYATGKTNIRVRGLRMHQTVALNAGEVAGVKFDSCTFCEVRDCEFEGQQWSGVMLNNSNDCTIAGNYFHDFLASSAGDKNDICVYRNSSYNIISDNRCYGGAQSWFGVMVQDPGGAGTFLPKNNSVTRNLVKAHAGYGIVVYIGGTQNSYNEISFNDVEGITGAAGSFYGSGIYCVGFGLGGLQVVGNNVRNCCSATTSVTNAPAGISVAGTVAGDISPVVIGNIVEGMTQAHGINIASCVGGAVVQGNTVRMPSTNNGTGAGGATLLGQCIKVSGSSDVLISGNKVRNNGTSDAILCIADTANFDRLVISDNIARATVGNAIRVDRLSSFIHTDVIVSSNAIRADGSSAALSLIGVDRVAVTGNNGGGNTGPAIAVTACTGARFGNNAINTNAAIGVTTAGTCTSSYYDKTNSIPGTITNAATGFKTEFFAIAAPAAGTGAVGDRAEQGTPVVGQPKGWRCTVAAAPGTWVSEGNL